LGEHLRNVRLERCLFQKDLGKRFGVHTESVKNWETGITVPTIHVIPKIIEFLGYDPEPLPSTLSRQIAYARRRLGYTQKELAKEICCVSFKIWEWESGRTIPHAGYLSKLERLLENARINFRLF
jgi:ribosome-binding protein aMBF1 (putative translation factor)